MPKIVEQAAMMAAHMPGFGNPYMLPVDAFDDALRVWDDAQPREERGMTPRERLERMGGRKR